MPDQIEGSVLLDVAEIEGGAFPHHKSFSKQPYDFSYWIDKEINMILIPYVPYFSYCSNRGRYMMVYELFESEELCSLIAPENTVPTTAIPTSLSDIQPLGDTCDYSVQC
jgi:hypothetical protein